MNEMLPLIYRFRKPADVFYEKFRILRYFLLTLIVIMTLSNCINATTPFKDRDVFFTFPGPKKAPDHVDKLIDLLALAVPESDVWIAIYMFNHEGLITAIENAAANHVNIYLIVGQSSEEMTSLKAKIKKISGEDRVFIFENSMGNKINHNKFVLFSHIISEGESVRNIVFQSSGNFTKSDIKKHQNSVILVDRNLYEAYLDYWQDLFSYGLDGTDNLNYNTTNYGDGYITKVYFFPRSEDDTIVNILNNLIPSTGTSSIKVVMSQWTDYRLDIAEKLAELKALGCDIQVITQTAGDNDKVSASILSILNSAGIKVMAFEENKVNIHSKYFIVDSFYKSGTKKYWQKIVWTGSHNFTYPALRYNDEILLKIHDANVYKKYLENFNHLVALWEKLYK